MEYKYITEDNLEHTQNYMYAQYGGMDFLEAYLQSRRPFLVQDDGDLPALFRTAFPVAETSTATALQTLLTSLYTDAGFTDRSEINRFIQRFEVRKRLFAEYDPATQRPVTESGYVDVRNYLLLAAIAERAYERFHSLKYLSCLLKLNDTLLSLACGLKEELLTLVRVLVTREVRHVTALAQRNGVVWKEDAECC